MTGYVYSCKEIYLSQVTLKFQQFSTKLVYI